MVVSEELGSGLTMKVAQSEVERRATLACWTVQALLLPNSETRDITDKVT
jgi:hypothetical protein